MRAIYHPEKIEGETLNISGDKLHHLVNVLRIETGDSLLILNGKGGKILGTVADVQKKYITIQIKEQTQVERKICIDVALGIPKRDALDLCLKQAVEIGVEKLYLIRSDFSQTKAPDQERLGNLLISALEQSNNTYLPVVYNEMWISIPWSNYDLVVLMDSQSQKEITALQKRELNKKILLIIGPEGGFSPYEMEFFESITHLCRIQLPTSIMRSPTALAVGAGFLIGRLLD